MRTLTARWRHRINMEYDPSIPLEFYERLAEGEWTRLTASRMGQLLFHNHLDVIRTHIKATDSVLELGAGAGRFTKELVPLCGSLLTSDLSPVQLEINRQKMDELGLSFRISGFSILDITDLSKVSRASFDAVVCTGGALNYAHDREKKAIQEILGVTKPGGIIILGVMSLIGTVLRYAKVLRSEKEKYGLEAMRWVLDTGIQDPHHYPVEDKNYVHMMRAQEVEALIQDKPVEIVERRAAGLFALAGEEALNDAAEDEKLWQLLLEKELEYSKNPAVLDCGLNLLYVLRRKDHEVQSSGG